LVREIRFHLTKIMILLVDIGYIKESIRMFELINYICTDIKIENYQLIFSIGMSGAPKFTCANQNSNFFLQNINHVLPL